MSPGERSEGRAASDSSLAGRSTTVSNRSKRPAKETRIFPPSRATVWGISRVRTLGPGATPTSPSPALSRVCSPLGEIHSTTGPPSPRSSKTVVRTKQPISSCWARGGTVNSTPEATGVTTGAEEPAHDGSGERAGEGWRDTVSGSKADEASSAVTPSASISARRMIARPDWENRRCIGMLI